MTGHTLNLFTYILSTNLYHSIVTKDIRINKSQYYSTVHTNWYLNIIRKTILYIISNYCHKIYTSYYIIVPR